MIIKLEWPGQENEESGRTMPGYFALVAAICMPRGLGTAFSLLTPFGGGAFTAISSRQKFP